MAKIQYLDRSGSTPTPRDAATDKIKVYASKSDIDVTELAENEIVATNDQSETIEAIIKQMVGSLLPVGSIIANMASSIEGYLLCDGSEFDSSEYPELYTVLGDNHVPNLVGAHLEGASTDTVTTNSNFTSNAPLALGTYGSSQNRSHSHTQYAKGGSTGSAGGYPYYGGGNGAQGAGSTSSSGGTVARPNSYAVNWFIKAE